MINRLKGAKRRQRYRSSFYMGRISYAKSGKREVSRAKGVVKLPKIFSLTAENYRNSLIGAIYSFHSLLKCGEKNIIFDFSETFRVFSSAMLLIYAEIRNALNHYQDVRLSCKRPRNDKVSHVLHQIGLYKIFRQSFTQSNQYSDVVHWRVCYGTEIIGNRYDDIVDLNNEIFDPEIDLYGGCVEATKNAHRHAYIAQRQLSPVEHTQEGWWIFSQVKDGNLSVNICDLGCSIPATMPSRRGALVRFLSLGGKPSDSDLIRGGIDGGKSRSGEPFRGNGLPKIARVAQDKKGASLEIHSRNGYVGIRQKMMERTYEVPTPGTIISWVLPLEAKNEKN